MKCHFKLTMLLVMAALFMIPANIGLAQPEYAKWGQAAVSEVKAEYPDYELKDYSYDGKVVISDEREQFTFTMTLEKNGESQKVKAYVLVNPQTEEQIEVSLEEID
ncbi:DUF3889 domain-containing protein [Alteribacillus sp. YIM 98480]|uniref:DUF3889 domain-containing protein n=1 Tax=Alteribacillus sp. YIM 98480 TaxID=2606599 RepID=UPI00131A6DA1|nr:DUF3889 domain-containing protein [Alteribacillus sp. YIM 98480]